MSKSRNEYKIQRKDNKFMRTHDRNHKDEGTEETDIWSHGKKEIEG